VRDMAADQQEGHQEARSAPATAPGAPMARRRF
jgi:hypothetical protein